MRPIALFAAILIASCPPARAGEAECRLIGDALIRMTASPVVLQTDIRSDFPSPIETIYATDAMYVSAGGNWKKMDLTSAARVAQLTDLLKQLPFRDCQAAGTETVGGRATSVFGYVQGPSDKPVDMQVWIGEDGLPYRWKGGPTTSTMRYDGVAVPEI